MGGNAKVKADRAETENEKVKKLESLRNAHMGGGGKELTPRDTTQINENNG